LPLDNADKYSIMEDVRQLTLEEGKEV